MDPSFGEKGVYGPDRFGQCAVMISNTEMKEPKEIDFYITANLKGGRAYKSGLKKIRVIGRPGLNFPPIFTGLINA